MDEVDATATGGAELGETTEALAGRPQVVGAPERDRVRARMESALFGDGAQLPFVGRYRLIRKLGEGGFGVVYAAHDDSLGRQVALKILADEWLSSAEARARAIGEARSLARLSHPNVVQVYEVGEHAGQVFVVMEFVDGPTLREWLGAAPRSWQAIVGLMRQAAAGLAAAHRAGVVHRDFKPANALIGSDGRVRVVDFGIARIEAGPGAPRAVAGEVSAMQWTMTGSVLGTPAYMAPEQLAGESVGAHSDQFAFCVALYEALYGERPFAGATVRELAASIAVGAIQMSTAHAVPASLERVVRRGLANHRAERWPSMDALESALAAVLAVDPARRRRGWALAGVGLVFVSTIAALAVRSASLSARAEEEVRRVERVLAEAAQGARRGRDRTRMTAAYGMSGDPTAVAAVLRDIEAPGETTGWRELAVETLRRPISTAVYDLGYVAEVHALPDGRRAVVAVSGGKEEGVRILDVSGRSAPQVVMHGRPETVAVRGDGREVAFPADYTHEVCRQHLDSEAPRCTKGHEGEVFVLRYTPDGRHLVSAAEDETIRVWSGGNATVLQMSGPISHGASGAALAVSDDRLAVGFRDEAGRMWRFAALEEAPRRLWGGSGWQTLEFSADGERLVSAGPGSAHVWTLGVDGAPVVLSGHKEPLIAAHFSPDGQRVLTAAHDAVRVWASDGSGAPEVFGRYDNAMSDAAWSPDGASVAVGSRDGRVYVYRADGSGRPFELRGATEWMTKLTYTPDGAFIVAVSFDSVRTWPAPKLGEIERNMDVEALRERLVGVTTMCLASEQRSRLFGESLEAAAAAHSRCERGFGRTAW